MNSQITRAEIIHKITKLPYLVLGMLLVIAVFQPAVADTYLQVYATTSDGRDTLGTSQHFLEFGRLMPVFIPPYTVHFTIYPLSESLSAAQVDFFELGPGYSDHHEQFQLAPEKWLSVDSLPAKGAWYKYSFRITKDTTTYLHLISPDSLVNFESIHFRAWIWRESYADYKWESRKSYLESVFDIYRKQLGVTRSGKLDIFVFPGSNSSACIDSYTGIGYDPPGNAMYVVFNRDFDSALPENIQRYVVYETMGYAPRSLAIGFSRYFLDDFYKARFIAANMTAGDIKKMLTDEFPEDIERADILSGAFVRFLVDQHSLDAFKNLYKKSAPGNFAFYDAYGEDFDEILRLFIDYEKRLHLTEPKASFYSDIYTGQLWLDKALEYDVWLGSQPINRELHLKQLGGAFFQIGNYAESESCYAALVKREPDNKEAAYLLGLAYLRNGKTKQAIAKLVEAADSLSNAANMLAELYLDRQQYDKAGEVLRKFAEPADSWSAILLARYFLVTDKAKDAGIYLDKAIALSSQTISNSPGEARGYIDAAYALMLKDSDADAEGELEVALFVESRPYYLGAANLALGRLYDLQNKHAEALEYYQQVMKLDSGKYLQKLATDYMKKPFSVK